MKNALHQSGPYDACIRCGAPAYSSWRARQVRGVGSFRRFKLYEGCSRMLECFLGSSGEFGPPFGTSRDGMHPSPYLFLDEDPR